jgi:hypothetical protein
MWILLRLLFGFLMYAAFKEARANTAANPMNGDIANAYWVGVVVVLAVANGVVWAPYLSEKVSDPLTGGTINAEFKEPNNTLMRLIQWCETRELRNLASWLCFIEGIRKPHLPAAFVLGMNNAREGSWLQKIYALEVFKFNNTQNCIKACEILARHGINPRPHTNPGVNLALVSMDHSVKEDPTIVDLPTAPPPPKIERNRRIQIGPD